MRLIAALLLVAALAGDADARFLPWGGGGPSTTSFTFSYPPTAVLPDTSVSFTNNFGTFSWTSFQIEDPGVTPHEQYGMWFLNITPVGGATQQLGLANGLGAFAMAKDVNGTVYIEQGDANWGPFVGWAYLQGSSSPEPLYYPLLALDVPTTTGPFTPSSPGTTITAPVGTATSLEGVWTWGALVSGTDYTVLLNGAHVYLSPPSVMSATTITINSNGKAFLHQASSGNNQPYLTYSISNSGPATAGPVPIGISFNPSFYQNGPTCNGLSTTCAPGFSISSGSNVINHVISTATVTMSDGSAFSGTLALFNELGGSPFPLSLSGHNLILNRVLNSGDLASTLGGPTGAFIWPTQNGVTLQSGHYNFFMTVVP